MKQISWAIGLAVLLLVSPFLPGDAAGAAGSGAHGKGGYAGVGGHHGGGGFHGGYHGWGGYRGGYYGGGGWWGGWGLGLGWWGVPYPYPYYYNAPPIVVEPAPPRRYIQPPRAPRYWYYCPNPQGYYPYVKDCSVRWIPVLPQAAVPPAPAPPAPAPAPVAPAPAAPAPPAPAPAAPAPVVERLTLHINFDTNKAVIRSADRAELQKALDFVKRYPGHKIMIAGHTDNTGTANYNQGLSERRAAAVKDYLLQNGVPDAGRITTVGYGLSRPVASNATENGRFQNRRVEIDVLPK